MRVLFYNHAPEVSGAERSLLSLMEGARCAGHETVLCAPRGPLSDFAREAGFVVLAAPPLVLGHTVNPFVLLQQGAHMLDPAVALAGAIKRVEPAVVHANSVRSGLVAALALRLVHRRPRLVVHLRDALRPGLSQRGIARVIGRASDATIAISRYVAHRIAPNGELPELHVLHNAIDPDNYRPDEQAGLEIRRQCNVPAGAPLLAVVGQITPWKGQREALEVLVALRRQAPAAHLLIVGSVKFAGRRRRYDNTAYHSLLHVRARQADLTGHVHFLGEVEDVRAVYAAADILLVPSWAEPFGRVVVESMAAGCPVVASDVGGIPEIVTHGVDGLLVPPRDPAALVSAVLTILRDDELRGRLVRRARLTVTERFSLAAYMPQLLAIWESVAATPSARHAPYTRARR